MKKICLTSAQILGSFVICAQHNTDFFGPPYLYFLSIDVSLSAFSNYVLSVIFD
jgi:hypothetical protein